MKNEFSPTVCIFVNPELKKETVLKLLTLLYNIVIIKLGTTGATGGQAIN